MEEITARDGSSHVQEIIAESWRAVLDVPEVSDDDDFFELGGYSIAVTRISSYLRRELGVDIDILQFWDTPIFGDFRAAVESLVMKNQQI